MADDILYKFIRMDLESFTTHEDKHPGDKDEFGISNSFDFAYSFQIEAVLVKTSLRITEEGETVIEAVLSTFFQLDSITASKLKGDNGSIVLPPELLAQFASLSYGSLRGILYAKTMGTDLEKLILPPNEIRGLFHSPMEFKNKREG